MTSGTPSPARPPSIDALDVLAPGAFAAAAAPLFEGAPRFLGRLAVARPFGSMERLFEAARRIAASMPEDEQLELINAHPRLGAAPGSVSALSFREQGYDRPPPDAMARIDPTAGTDPTAGIDRDRTVDVAAALRRLNDAYEARFGFRYCVFVAGRSREALIPGFEAATQADRGDELARALAAVIDIAADRHARLTREAARASQEATR